MPALDARALYQVYADALDRVADSELILRERWGQLRTPSSPYPTLNKVFLAQLDEDEVEARIEGVKEEYRGRGADFGWMVGHGSSPGDLSARLEAAGVPLRGEMVGMVRAVDGPRCEGPAGLRIEAATADDADALASLMRRAWERSAVFEASVRDKVRRALSEPEPDHAYLIAYLDDEPVGMGTLRWLRSGLGYLQRACVMGAHRGRGIYTALTQARLEELARRGYGHVVIGANPTTSEPVARCLGFRAVARARYHDSEG